MAGRLAREQPGCDNGAARTRRCDMAPSSATVIPPFIVYPDSDGKPMADNTKQLRWMVVLFGNLSALFRDVRDVFIAADLLWYPVEGHAEVRNAPDVLAVFGR